MVAVELNVSELEKGDRAMLDSWWFTHRFIIFSLFILEILSVAGMIRGLVFHTIMMTPNPYVMSNGCDSYDDIIKKGGYFTVIAFTRDSFNPTNTWAYTALCALFSTVPGPVACLLIWSGWIASQAQVKSTLIKEPG